MIKEPIIIRQYGLLDYLETVKKMEIFTDQRTNNTPSEIWILQHPAVYTLGQAADPKHILNAGNIPIIRSNRGGQVTYHGKGQLIAYCLLDLKQLNMGVKQLVERLEAAIINVLARHQINAKRREKAPGVYVQEAKIAALGLRVRRGCTFHGLALNIEMDLNPFKGINPCGYPHLMVTQMAHFGTVNFKQVEDELINQLLQQLN